MDFREKKIEGNGHVAIHDWAPVDESGRHKNSVEIEHDISETRHSMDSLLDALEGRVNPRSIIDRMFDFFQKPENQDRAKRTLSNVGHNISESFQRNPLPVMMLTTGAAWMLWENQRKPERYEYTRGEPGRYTEKGHEISGKGKEMTEGLKGKFSEGEEKFKGEAQQFREGAMRKGEELERKTSEYSSMAKERFHEGTSMAKERFQEGTQSTNRFIQENPLVTGAIAMVAGLLFGALMPTTEREKEVLGKPSQEAMDKVKDEGQKLEQRGEEKILQAEDRITEATKEKVARSEKKENKPKGENLPINRGTTEPINPEIGKKRIYPDLPENI